MRKYIMEYIRRKKSNKASSKLRKQIQMKRGDQKTKNNIWQDDSFPAGTLIFRNDKTAILYMVIACLEDRVLCIQIDEDVIDCCSCTLGNMRIYIFPKDKVTKTTFTEVRNRHRY